MLYGGHMHGWNNVRTRAGERPDSLLQSMRRRSRLPLGSWGSDAHVPAANGLSELALLRHMPVGLEHVPERHPLSGSEDASEHGDSSLHPLI